MLRSEGLRASWPTIDADDARLIGIFFRGMCAVTMRSNHE